MPEKVKLELGMIGFSLEDIKKEKEGNVYFPDLKQTLKVEAEEEVDKYKEVIVVKLPKSVVERQRLKTYLIVSDKDQHFTESLAQDAAETENIHGLLTNKIRIRSITILSDQKLFYRLHFYSKDTFDDDDLDEDTYLASVDLDLETDGIQYKNTGKWLLTVFPLAHFNQPLIEYIDEDEEKELHLSLENLSSTSKNKGATGEVVIKIIYEPVRGV